MFLPALVCLSVCLFVCLFVCYHDNKIKRGRIWTKFFGKVPKGKSKPKFVIGYDRWPGVEVTVQKRRKPGIFSM